uniref:Bulb-type lectin domain-containing protein n=1 Tax=Panagrellus redivivus TaxID=6233 RepID=A0A7E4VBL6_PANRE
MLQPLTNTSVYLFLVPYPIGPPDNYHLNNIDPHGGDWLYAGKAVTDANGDFKINGWNNVENVNAMLQPTLVFQMDDKYCKVEVNHNGQIMGNKLGNNQHYANTCDEVKQS